MEQERLDALFADEMDIQNVQELYDGLWDKETQTMHIVLVADLFNEEELIKMGVFEYHDTKISRNNRYVRLNFLIVWPER